MRFIRISGTVATIFVAALVASACGSDTKSGSSFGVPAGGGTDGGLSSSGGFVGIGGSNQGGGVGLGGAGAGGANLGGTNPGGGTGTGGANGGGSSLDASVGDGASPVDGSTSGDGSAPSGCQTNSDCAGNPDGKVLCDAANGACIQCHTALECLATEQCVSGACVPLKTCTNSLNCAGNTGGMTICDTTDGVCVQCTKDGDCGQNQICAGRACRTGCTSDNDCTPQGLLCNQGLGGICTQCVVSADCAADQFCNVGSCVPDSCIAGAKSCDRNTVVQCNAVGNGTTIVTSCTSTGAACVEANGSASCQAVPPPDAGTPPPPVDAGTSGCSDKMKDGAETAVDCGGPTCKPCATAQTCSLARDCTSGVCDYCNISPFCVLQKTCQAATCTDGVKNGLETGVDCGGGGGRLACPRCGADEACTAGTDCLSGTCTNKKCTAPKCVTTSCPTCFPNTRCCTASDTCGCVSAFGGACQ